MNVDIGGPSGRSRSRKRTEGVSTGQCVVMTIIPMVVVRPKLLAPVYWPNAHPNFKQKVIPSYRFKEAGK